MESKVLCTMQVAHAFNNGEFEVEKDVVGLLR